MTSLQVHQTIHSQNKTSLECQICFKHFFNSRTLERHQKIHKNVKFKCNLCEKVVSNRKDNIRRHIRHLHADITRSEIASLIITIYEPIQVESLDLDVRDDNFDRPTEIDLPQPTEETLNPQLLLPIIDNRVKVIQTVGNPNKHVVHNDSPPEAQETVVEIKLPPKKKAIALSQTSSSAQVPKPKYDPIQHYRKILGFKDDDHPTTTEDNTEDEEMEPQVFPIHWRKRTSQNFLFRR